VDVACPKAIREAERQVKDRTALRQKMASEGAEPIARSVGQALKKSLSTTLSFLGGTLSPAYPHRGNLHHPHRPDPTIVKVVSFFVVELA
jgi:hypothetical protein